MKTKTALHNGATFRFEKDELAGAEAATSTIAPAPPPKQMRAAKVKKVAKIDPEKGIAAIIPIKTNDMRVIRKMVGSKHVGEQLVTTLQNLEVRVCCATIGSGKIWRVRGSLPVRGRALLYAHAGFGPADFPGDAAWLKRMIEFEPTDIDRAINDKREKTDDAG